jgi:alkanesulfonate monooxygenase SsuD/methylene tetrahydromethanopterin reductase-like flavin-dependent oxidoreductase (luciferase family)
LILAKELATVDVLSCGRLMFGVGVGYVQREFEALDASFGDRGARTEEYLAAIRSIWTERHPVFAGRMVSFAGVQAFPHPVQQPHPPIVMGGYAPAVMRRTIREADGWYGWGLDLEDTARRVDILRETASRVPRGEGLGSLEITITPPGDVDVETAARYAALGVHRLNLMLPWGAGRDDVDGFFERVMQPLVEADLE